MACLCFNKEKKENGKKKLKQNHVFYNENKLDKYKININKHFLFFFNLNISFKTNIYKDSAVMQRPTK